MIAVLEEASSRRREMLHSLELPTAQLTAMHANLNRDPKKQRKPYSALDFCLFADREASRPEALAAAAYMRLVEDKRLPPWALFCIADFKHATAALRSADEVAMIHDSFILLAPVPIEGGFTGLMLAEGAISNSTIQITYEDELWAIQIPKLEGFTVATSNIELDAVRLQQSAETSGSASPSSPHLSGSPAPAML